MALPDESAALYNRMLLLRFTNSFLGKEDTELDAKLLAELPGILLWAIEGYKRLRAEGRFTEPASGIALRRVLRATGSPVATFVEERCVVKAKVTIQHGKLYESYKEFCKELDIVPVGNSRFGTELIEAVPSITDCRPSGKGKKSRPRYYSGIELKKSAIESATAPNDNGHIVSPSDDAVVTVDWSCPVSTGIGQETAESALSLSTAV
jgi:phage/plasmid-associated DNA primase